MVLPDLVPNAEGIEGAEGVRPCREGEPRRAQRRRRLQHQAPHPFPARHDTTKPPALSVNSIAMEYINSRKQAEADRKFRMLWKNSCGSLPVQPECRREAGEPGAGDDDVLDGRHRLLLRLQTRSWCLLPWSRNEEATDRGHEEQLRGFTG